jgi:O-antigen ligase
MLKTHIQTISWIIALTGLFTEEFARAYTSISMVILVAVNIYLAYCINADTRVINKYRHTVLILVAGFTLIYLGAFLYDSPSNELYRRIMVKLPFIVIPISILFAPNLQRSQVKQIVVAFGTIVLIIAFCMLINYLMHFEEFNKLYTMSSVMPSPINHIRLSLIFAFTAYLLYFFIFIQPFFVKNKTERVLAIFAMIFLIAFTHIYSVRGGMIALYAIAFFEFMKHLLNSEHAKKLIAGGLVAFAIVIVAGLTVPTIKNKIAITISELQQYKYGNNINHSSLGKRLASYDIAWDIFKNDLIVGCGIGNYENINRVEFNSQFPEVEVPIIVHNQFLYYLAASGLIGFLIFSYCFFHPLFKQHQYPRLFIIHLIVLFVSFQTEPMLETQLGVAYAVLFWAFSLSTNDDIR